MARALTIGAISYGGEAVAKIRSPRLQPGVPGSFPNFTSPLKRATERATQNPSLSPAKAGSQYWERPEYPRLKPYALTYRLFALSEPRNPSGPLRGVRPTRGLASVDPLLKLAPMRLKPGATDLAPASPALTLRTGTDPTTDNRSPITRCEVVH